MNPAGGSLATATNLGLLVTAGARINGDLSTLNDGDYYKLTTPGLLGLTGFAVRVQTSGYSLLTPRLSVLDAHGNVVNSVQKSSPLDNDLSMYVKTLVPLSTYYVRIDQGTGTTFGIGSYHLAIDPVLISTNVTNLLNSTVTGTVDTLFLNNLLNNSLLSALPLGLVPYAQTPGDPNPGFTAYYRGDLAQTSQTSYYRVASPVGAAGSTTTLTAMVWAASTSLQPRLHVFDAAGKPVLAQVITNNGSTYTLQIQHAASNSTYFVEVASSQSTSGNYCLAVDYHTSPPVVLQDLGGGTLTGAAPEPCRP